MKYPFFYHIFCKGQVYFFGLKMIERYHIDFLMALLLVLPVIFIMDILGIKDFHIHGINSYSFLLLVILSPVCEEVIFRIGLQNFILSKNNKRLGFISYANIITALTFCLFHTINQSFLWSLAVFVPALVFGYFYEKKRSVWAPIGLHVFYNAIFFTMLF